MESSPPEPSRRDYKGAFIQVLKVVVYFVSVTLYFNEQFEKSTLDGIYFGVVMPLLRV